MGVLTFPAWNRIGAHDLQDRRQLRMIPFRLWMLLAQLPKDRHRVHVRFLHSSSASGSINVNFVVPGFEELRIRQLRVAAVELQFVGRRLQVYSHRPRVASLPLCCSVQ